MAHIAKVIKFQSTVYIEEVVDPELNLNGPGGDGVPSGDVPRGQSFNLWRTIWPWIFGSAFLILLVSYWRRRNKR